MGITVRAMNQSKRARLDGTDRARTGPARTSSDLPILRYFVPGSDVHYGACIDVARWYPGKEYCSFAVVALVRLAWNAARKHTWQDGVCN